MALVRHLEHATLQVEAKHSEASATYTLVKDGDGTVFLQIDTYGSAVRKLTGKKSQSLRLSPEAVEELKAILERHF